MGGIKCEKCGYFVINDFYYGLTCLNSDCSNFKLKPLLIPIESLCPVPIFGSKR